MDTGDYIFVKMHRLYNTKSESNVSYGPGVVGLLIITDVPLGCEMLIME